jgi:hypothetical protein
MSTRTVSIIVSPQDEVNLATVAERYPLVTRHRLAQAAYRYGLRACVRCPDIVLEEARLADADARESSR